MKKLKAPRLVTIAIFTTITVVFWVFLSLYRVLTAASPPNVPPEILAPISPNLDVNVLETLSNRVFFEEGEVEIPATPSFNPAPATEEILKPTSLPSTPTPTKLPAQP